MISFLENIVTCSFLTTQYCRKNTTYFLSNLQWSLRQLFCALSPEQTGHPCVLKWKRKIQDLLTFYWITHKFAFSVQVISKRLLTFYLRYIHTTIVNIAIFKYTFCKPANYYKKTKPQTNLHHTVFVILYVCHWLILHQLNF